MNDKSGSALQKASFALLVLIAAALAYLIVRDRVRSERVSIQVPAPSAASSASASAPTPPRLGGLKSSFIPLRSRPGVETERVATNQRIVARNSIQSAGSASADVAPDAPWAAGARIGTLVPGAAVVGVAASRGKGSISGRVSLRGAPPPEKAITLDAMCGRLHPAPMFTRHFMLGRDGGLGNVFVYIQSGAPNDDSQQEVIPVLDNVACQFQPYMLGVRAGQPFTLRNSDPVLHNMHMMPRSGSRNREVNIGMPVKNASSTKVYDHPEVFIKVKCDVHPWMFAYIGVVEHRWFAVTEENGNFALPPGLPPGRYNIAAVHLKAGKRAREITVSDAGTETVDFTLEAPDDLTKTQ